MKGNESKSVNQTDISINDEASELPDNAFRELKDGEEYIPVMRPNKEYSEVTPYSVSVGLILAVIFSAAAAYLGLKCRSSI